MRKLYLALTALFIQVLAFSQTNIYIGSGGTTGNTGTNYPCPLQDYYEGSRAQYLYLASELNAAGMGPGNISSISYDVQNLNAFTGTIEQFTVSIGTTTTASLTNNSWEAGTSAVYGPVDYATTTGPNVITFNTPFFWNGTDNIVVEVCNGDPNNATTGVVTYTENATVPWTTGLSFNGSHTYRADNLGNLCGTATTTNSGTQTTRPDITFSWAPSSTTGCYLPSGTAISNITSATATASWNPPTVGSTASQYNWEVRTSGAGGSGSTGLVASGTTAATTVNISALSSSTTYYFYVQSDCGSGSTSIWSSGYSFITSCAALTNFSENFDAVVVPALPTCWFKVGPDGLANTQTTNPNSSPNTLYVYGTSATAQAVVSMPAVSNVDSNNHQIRFSMRANFTAGAIVQVGYLTDPADATTFVSFQDITASTLTYQTFTVIPTGVSGPSVVFAFRHTGSLAYSVLIDDVAWEPIPSCVEPNTLVVSNVDITTAQLDWTAPSVSSPASYEVYYSTSNTPPVITTVPSTTGIGGTNYNFTGLTPATKYYVWVRSNCGTGGFSNWSAVDSFTTLPSCDVPTALVVSNVTGTTAQVDWTAPATGSPASYEIYSSISATAPGGTTTPTATGITNTTYNLSTLTPATKYYVWVRSNCGTGGVSTWSVVDSFYTQCDATNVPYTQNFESASVPALPNCTSAENVGTGNNWVTANNPGSGFTSNTLEYLYNFTNPADAWFYTQGLNLTAGTSYRLSFKYGNNSTTYVESMNVSFGTGANAASMTDLIVDYPSITGNVPATSSTDFTPSATGVYYIGFHVYSIANQYNLYVDDIAVDVTPTCDVPTLLPVTNITGTGATINWNAPASSPSGYDIYYSTTNTTPTGTTTPTATGINNTTYDFTTLLPSTKYFYWIRSNCGAGGVSVWTGVDSFFTLCDATNIPYIQDFESVAVPALPNCTSIENVGTGNNWVTANNPGSGFTSNTLKYGYNFTNPADAWFYTQGLNLTAGTSYRLSFKYGNNSTTYVESMNVSFGNAANAASMTDLIVDYPSITGGVPATSGTDFTPSATGIYYIGFHVYSIANQYNLYVDDISVDVPPTCDVPTALVLSNITGNSAQFDWSAPVNGSPVSYDVYYNTSNTPPTSATVPSVAGVTGNTANLTGLSNSTTYYVWVRSNCGTTLGNSLWSSSAIFTTLCGVVSTPTAAPETFSTAVPPSTCWTSAKGILADPFTTFTTTGTSSWVADDFGNVTTPVNNSARLNIWTTTTNDWLITPSYDLGTGGNMKLEFDLAYTPYSGTTPATLGPDDKFAVVISTDNGITWALANALRTWDATTPISNTGEHIVIDLSTYSGVVMFGFYGESTVSNADNNVYVDNVQITPLLLPVTLSSFKGERQGAKNLLTWTTASEQNNKGYELQRSSNGENFSTITFVNSKAVNGNSSTALSYNYADEKPFTGNNYYRLKQVDFDGKSTLSNIVLIKGKVNALVLSSVYPNPAKNQLNVVLSAPAGDKVSVVVTDVAGKVVMQQATQIVSGDNNLKLNVAGLLSGTYMIKVVCNNGCETAVSKFVKQ